jgi:hypothetical protein
MQIKVSILKLELTIGLQRRPRRAPKVNQLPAPQSRKPFKRPEQMTCWTRYSSPGSKITDMSPASRG